MPEAAPARAAAPTAEPIAPTPVAIAAAVATPAPRVTLTPQQPASPVAAPAPAADASEPVVAAPVVIAASDADADAPPAQPAQTAQAAQAPSPAPPTAAPAPTPVRNGSARLDERQSNAATSNASEAKADAPASAQARANLTTATPAATTPATTAALNDKAAPAPILPADVAPLDAQADLAPSQQILDAQAAASTAQRDLGQSQLSRATVETTAQLAAQILKKLEGRSTRFDMALTPEGLGRVDVSLEIDSDGRLAARLAFDNPAAATDMRARADELRRQLQDAGFQLTQDSLEFSERNPSSGFGGGGAFDRAPDRRAFAGAARLAAQADAVLPPPGAWTSLSMTPDRVDMKV